MKELITEPEDSKLDELLSYVPEYSEENARNIKGKFISAANNYSTATSKKRRRIFRVGLIAAVLCVLSVATALAAVLGDIDFDEFLSRGGERWEIGEFYIYTDGNPLNTRRLEANYVLEFTDFDEIRDLFRVQIGNKYMDNLSSIPSDPYIIGDDGQSVHIGFGDGYFSGALIVVTEDDIPIAASISAVFEIDELLFLSSIWINLDGHDLALEDIGFRPRLWDDPEGVTYTYYCESNGIVANILIMDEEGLHGVDYIDQIDKGGIEEVFTPALMEIYFFHDEVFYHFASFLFDVDYTYGELLEIVKRFINAFG